MSRIHSNIQSIDKYIIINICYHLDIIEIVNLFSMNKKFRRIHSDLEFWKFYLVLISGLNKSFFTPYENKEEVLKLCIDFYNYNTSGDYDYIKTHINIVNFLYTTHIVEREPFYDDISEDSSEEESMWFGSHYDIVIYGGLPLIKYIFDNGYSRKISIKELCSVRYDITEDMVMKEYLKNTLYIVNECKTVDYVVFIHLMKLGYIDIVKNASNKLDTYPHSGILYRAIDTEDIDIVKYIIETFSFDMSENKSKRLFRYAIKTSNVDIVDYIRHKFNINIEFCDLQYAVDLCYVKVVKYLTYEIDYISTNMFIYIIRSKNLDIIDLIAGRYNIRINNRIINAAIATCNIDLVKYIIKLFKKKITVKSLKYTIWFASQICSRPQEFSNIFRIVDLLIDVLSIKVDSSLFRYTISHKNIEVIKHVMKEYDLNVNLGTVKYAASTKDKRVFGLIIKELDKEILTTNIPLLANLVKQCK